MGRTKLLIAFALVSSMAVAGLVPAASAGTARGSARAAQTTARGDRATAARDAQTTARGDRATAARAPVQLRFVRVATGLNGPSGFTVGRGGRIWYLERGTGEIRILTPSTNGDRLFASLSGVDGSGERGALGIALHPRYPKKPFVYVYVTRIDRGILVNELLRIRSVNGQGAGRRVLFKWAVGSASNHNGGRILFGPDGNLWIMTGDNAVESNSQRRANLRGKVLRIRPNGNIPATNPFGTRIWAYGIRNSFGLAFDPRTGLPWETENGPSCNDEINLIRRGGNYAWGPNQSCPNTNRDGPAPRRRPKWNFPSTIGVTGAAFCDGCRLGGGRQGDLFVGDVNSGSVRILDLNAARNDITRARRVLQLGSGIHSMEVSVNGRIYVSASTGIWRIARA